VPDLIIIIIDVDADRVCLKLQVVFGLFAMLTCHAVKYASDISDHDDVLRPVYTKVSKKLDAQGVARYMYQWNALTPKELQSVHAKRSEPIKAAEELLHVVMAQSGNVFRCFLDALKKTGHLHLYKSIVAGSYKGTHYCATRRITVSHCSS